MHQIFDRQLMKRQKDGKKDSMFGEWGEKAVVCFLQQRGLLVDIPDDNSSPYDVSFRDPTNFKNCFTGQIKDVINGTLDLTSRPSGKNPSAGKIVYSEIGGGIDWIFGVDMFKLQVGTYPIEFYKNLPNKTSFSIYKYPSFEFPFMFKTPQEIRAENNYYHNKEKIATLDMLY
jgi:hypothetical protein